MEMQLKWCEFDSWLQDNVVQIKYCSSIILIKMSTPSMRKNSEISVRIWKSPKK